MGWRVGGVWRIDPHPARPGGRAASLEAASIEAASLEEASPEAARAGGGRVEGASLEEASPEAARPGFEPCLRSAKSLFKKQ